MASGATPPRKDDVYSASIRLLAELQPTTDQSTPVQPAILAARGPEPSGLTRDELRQIILDLIG